jgi:uncharacterized protein Usg
MNGYLLCFNDPKSLTSILQLQLEVILHYDLNNHIPLFHKFCNEWMPQWDNDLNKMHYDPNHETITKMNFFIV